MSTGVGVGILGVGTHLPTHVRENDWWPADLVAQWREQQARTFAAVRAMPPPPSDGARKAIAAMLELDGDPFEGARRRHVLADDRIAADMEAAAAEEALARAGIDRGRIGLLLTHSAVPEYLLANTACALHQRLGLPAACLALEAQASAYSFMAQLALAVPMIESGRVTHALLVQSSAITRLIDPADPVGARVGDAATAVVVGPVAPDRGVVGAYHRTDGVAPRALIASVPGGRWYDGPSLMHVADPAGARGVFMRSIDQSKEAIDGALAAAGRSAGEVDFLAVHHATPWTRRLVQAHAGLDRARSVDLFAETAYVFATSVPLVLAAGEREKTLSDGDLVVLMGAGTGMIYGATALVWGPGRS